MAEPQTTPTATTSTRTPDARATEQVSRQAVPQRAQLRAARPWFKKKHIALPSAVFLTFVAIMISTGGNDPWFDALTPNTNQSGAESAGTLGPGVATMGQSTHDGRLAFTVSSVQRTGRTLTDRFGATQTAEGMFVIVRVAISNLGGHPRALTATDQFLLSDKGQRFATSSATTLLRGAESILLGRINPGQTVAEATLLFDVPADTTIAGIELHDSPSSAGTTVKLS